MFYEHFASGPTPYTDKKAEHFWNDSYSLFFKDMKSVNGCDLTIEITSYKSERKPNIQ